MLELIPLAVAKAFVLAYARRKARRRRTRVATTVYGLAFAPALAELMALLGAAGVASISGVDLFFYSLLGIGLDLGVVTWIRVLLDPLDALGDVEYDPSLTNY